MFRHFSSPEFLIKLIWQSWVFLFVENRWFDHLRQCFSCMHTHLQYYTHIHTHTHSYTHTYTHTHIHTHTHTNTTYTHTHTHTHIHTHTHTHYSDIAGATDAAKRNVRDFVQRRITTPTVSIMNDVVLNRLVTWLDMICYDGTGFATLLLLPIMIWYYPSFHSSSSSFIFSFYPFLCFPHFSHFSLLIFPFFILFFISFFIHKGVWRF